MRNNAAEPKDAAEANGFLETNAKSVLLSAVYIDLKNENYLLYCSPGTESPSLATVFTRNKEQKHG